MEIELPNAISPDQAILMLKKRLERYVKDIKQFSCVNALITITEPSYNTETKQVNPGDFKFSDDHCKNQRRNGSKFCQACSDKHHGISSPTILTDEHMRPGMEVEKHLREHGHLPEEGCCDKKEVDSTCYKLDESKPETCPGNCRIHGKVTT